MELLIYFGSSFLVFFLVYVIFINRKRKAYNPQKGQFEIDYLIRRFNLDLKKMKFKNIKLIVSILNSFIMAFTFTLIIEIKWNYFLKLLLAFAVMFVLIYSLYEIVGRVLRKKQESIK